MAKYQSLARVLGTSALNDFICFENLSHDLAHLYQDSRKCLLSQVVHKLHALNKC